MTSDKDEQINALSGDSPKAKEICRALCAEHPGYLDALESFGFDGFSICFIWDRCSEDLSNFIDLLEAGRNGLCNMYDVVRSVSDPTARAHYGFCIAQGRDLPRSERLS